MEWRQSPAIFQPSLVASSAATLEENEVIVEVPLQWMFSTRLPRAVLVSIEGDRLELPDGLHLPGVLFIGEDDPESIRNAYCTRPGFLGTLRAPTGLQSQIAESIFGSNDKQICLEDRDADGSLDFAFARRLGSAFWEEDLIDLGPVDPLPAMRLEGETIDPERDWLRFKLKSVRRNSVEIELEISRFYGELQFRNFRSGPFTARAYNRLRFGDERDGTLDLLGIRFGVSDASASDDQASLHWQPHETEDTVIVVPEYSVGY